MNYDKIKQALYDAWDQGNALGLDGWIGPERGEEPDGYAIEMRKQYVEELLDDLGLPAAQEALIKDNERWAASIYVRAKEKANSLDGGDRYISQAVRDLASEWDDK